MLEFEVEMYAHKKEEEEVRAELTDLLKSCPIPDSELLLNLGLFLHSKNLSRLLFLDYLYRQIIETQGVVFDFGTRWGQNAAMFAALRGIYEPFNRHRKIITFDTFKGFLDISECDGDADFMHKGGLSVSTNYEDFIDRIMKCHESLNPASHIKKYEIIKGDAIKEIKTYLKTCPSTIVALAFFDFDIYAPTKECLEAILPRLVKGSVLSFDELNDEDSPGETLALIETLGLNNIRLKRSKYASRVSYCVIE